jgi:hypothetical protein
MVRSANIIRAMEINHPGFLGRTLYTDRVQEGTEAAWYRRGEIDSVVVDLENRVVTIGVDQRDYIHMDLGRVVLITEKAK